MQKVELIHNLYDGRILYSSYACQSPLILFGVLRFSAPRSPLTLPYSHCNIIVLPVIVIAAAVKRTILAGVSNCANKGYG
jgi:hypothetical protein